MNTCKTCKHWEPVPRDPEYKGKRFELYNMGGECSGPKLTEFDGYQLDILVHLCEEHADLWTGPDFGCVHHAAKDV